MFTFDSLNLGKNTYLPSRFILRLDLPIDLQAEDDEVFRDEYKMSIFIHEYIHFLQDISTRYGLMKLSNYYMSTKAIAHTIRQSRQISFKTPPKLKSKQSNNVIFQNYHVFFNYLGSGIIDEFKQKNIEILSYRFERKYKHEIAYVKLDIDGIGNKEIILGGEILCESMAYLAEKNYIDSHNAHFYPPHEYPYLVCSKLLEFIYPELKEDTLTLFLIIDQCLYRYFNPGPSFIQLIEYIKTKSIHNKDIENKRICIDSFFEVKKPELLTYNLVITEVIREIKDCFQSSEFTETIKWIEILYNRCLFLRQYPYCFKGFMDQRGLDSFAHQIYKNILGQPVVLNDIYDGIYQPPSQCFTFKEAINVHPEYFSAILCIRNVFNNGFKGNCLLKSFCTQSQRLTGKQMVDQYCDTPWLKFAIAQAQKKDLCPFAVIWKHWGMTNQCPK